MESVSHGSDEEELHVPMPVYKINTGSLVWNLSHAKRLRHEYGIIGTMAGTLPEHRQQNIAKGLPLFLSNEEVSVALKKKCITVVSSEHRNPNSNATFYDEQSNPNPENFEEIDIELKVKNAIKTEKQGKNRNLDYFEEKILNHKEVKLFLDPSTPEKIEVHLKNNFEHPSIPWPFPKSQKEKLRLIVFYDLHSKGYRIRDGINFGADFLAYPGDPSSFHSQFTVRVAPWNENLSPLILIGESRVSLSTRKRLVIASVKNMEEDSIMDCLFRVKYITFVTDLEIVPFEARTQRPNVVRTKRDPEPRKTDLINQVTTNDERSFGLGLQKIKVWFEFWFKCCLT